MTRANCSAPQVRSRRYALAQAPLFLHQLRIEIMGKALRENLIQ